MNTNDHMEKIKAQKAAMANGQALLQKASALTPVPCNNPSEVIIFDTKTTGLSDKVDEIIHISVIDGDGNTLIDTYVRPYWMTRWPDAQMIHGITPEMVKNAPTPEELIPVVKGIFESAKTAVSYKGSFDMSFLEKWGIKSNADQVDLMPLFAEIYGEFDEQRQKYKLQKLSTAAEYYGYEEGPQGNLSDVKATMYVWKKMFDNAK